MSQILIKKPGHRWECWSIVLVGLRWIVLPFCWGARSFQLQSLYTHTDRTRKEHIDLFRSKIIGLGMVDTIVAAQTPF